MDLERYQPSVYPITLTLPGNLGAVEGVRGRLAAQLTALGVPKDRIHHICLALDETLTNAVEHGSARPEQTIEVGYRIDRDWIEVAVTDQGGIVFNPEYFEQLAAIKTWGAGGRGLLLIRRMMDEVYFVFTPGRSTRVIFRKRLFESENATPVTPAAAATE